MRKILSITALILALGLAFTVEPAFSAKKINHHKVSKQSGKVTKVSKKSKKVTKASKKKKINSAKSRIVRVRHASNINNPSEGDNLKLESIAKDLLGNEQ